DVLVDRGDLTVGGEDDTRGPQPLVHPADVASRGELGGDRAERRDQLDLVTVGLQVLGHHDGVPATEIVEDHDVGPEVGVVAQCLLRGDHVELVDAGKAFACGPAGRVVHAP